MGSRDQGSLLEVWGRPGGLEGRSSEVRGQVRVQMVGSRISDSFGYLQRSLQGLFVGLVRRFRAEVLYRLRR